MRDDGAVLQPHSTDEGGEPQGSRKGRPRYPPEGRGKHVPRQNSEQPPNQAVKARPTLTVSRRIIRPPGLFGRSAIARIAFWRGTGLKTHG